MRKKILVVSIFAAVMMVLLPISAVVGTNIVKSDAEKRSIASPLFAKRVNNVLKKETETIDTDFLGKGKIFNAFFTQKTSLHSWIDKAIKIIDAKPELLTRVLNKIYEIPELVNLLEKYGVNKNDLNKEIVYATSDPTILRQKIDEVVESYEGKIELPAIEPPSPLGWSGNFGCLLTFFLVIFPLIMFIGGFLTAILALIIPGTFLIPGCLEWIAGKVFEELTKGLQGLTPP